MGVKITDSGWTINVPAMMREVAEQVGQYGVNQLIKMISTQELVTSGVWKPKSPRTLRRRDYRGKFKLWVKTGELRSVLKHKIEEEGDGSLIVYIGIFNHPKGTIAAYLEYGTGGSVTAGGVNHTWERIPARPLFRMLFVGDGDQKLQKFIERRLTIAINKAMKSG